MKQRLLVWALMFVLLPGLLWAANEYYTHGNFPSPSSPATSASMRAELDLISAGFDKLPAVTGKANKAVVVNSSGTGLTTTTGNLSLAGNFSVVGAFAVALQPSAPVTITLPSTNGTMATVQGNETLTGKTINLSSNVLSGTRAQFNSALSDDDFATLNGTETLFNKTLAIPTITGGAINSADINNPIVTNGSMTSTLLTNPVFGGTGATTGPSGFTFGGLITVTNFLTVNGGILFPAVQAPSLDVNTLDDYEEGTWTPAVGGSATYTTQTGHYTKIGRIVHANFNLVINAIGTGSSNTISGLPFTSAASSFSVSPCRWSVGAVSPTHLNASIGASSATLLMVGTTGAAANDSTQNVIGSSTSITCSVTYETTT